MKTLGLIMSINSRYENVCNTEKNSPFLAFLFTVGEKSYVMGSNYGTLLLFGYFL